MSPKGLSADTRKHLGVIEEMLRRAEEGAPVSDFADDADAAYGLALRAAIMAGERKRAPADKRRALSFTQMISRRLRRLRDDAGWTQKQLAEAMQRAGHNWKQVTVAEVEIPWEQDEPDKEPARKVSLEELLTLAALYSVPMFDLLLPRDADYLRLADRLARPADVREAMLGPGGRLSAGGPTAGAAARLLGARPGRHDWRPANDLWERWGQGIGDPVENVEG